eukprot:366070-Amorphochlora_amoeboformis.AAC.1
MGWCIDVANRRSRTTIGFSIGRQAGFRLRVDNRNFAVALAGALDVVFGVAFGVALGVALAAANWKPTTDTQIRTTIQRIPTIQTMPRGMIATSRMTAWRLATTYSLAVCQPGTPCTAPASHCRTRGCECMHSDCSADTRGPRPLRCERLWPRTWAASTCSSTVHRSSRASASSRGTCRLWSRTRRMGLGRS